MSSENNASENNIKSNCTDDVNRYKLSEEAFNKLSAYVIVNQQQTLSNGKLVEIFTRCQSNDGSVKMLEFAPILAKAGMVFAYKMKSEDDDEYLYDHYRFRNNGNHQLELENFCVTRSFYRMI